MGNINTSGCYLINGIQFACSNDAGLIDLYNISTINGLPPGSGGGDGSGMPQTPWFSNINAANYNLYNLSLLNGQPVNLVPDYSTAFPGDILTIGPTGVPEWDPPNISQDQTPWLQDVDAANFSLSNLTNLNGLPVSYYLQSPWVQPVNAAGNALYNVPVLQFPNGTQLYSNSTTGALLLWGTSVGEVARAPFGISSSSSFLPQYPLDVVGNANISGCYYIQGIALACYNSGAAGFDLTNINTINGLPPGSGGGQNQTPWQSNIDANNYNLYNLNCVVLGTITPGPFYICIDINGSAQYSNKNQSGVIWMTQSGFLGIGIQQPPYPLDVYSPQDYSARIRSHTSFCGLIIDHDLTSGGESIVSFRSANNEAAIIQYDSDEDALIFWTGARDAANSTLTCDTNSRVGILTTSPLYELDVNGDCNISGTYRVNGVPLSTGGGFWQGGSAGAIYYNGGNVGIGISNPDGTLTVASAPSYNSGVGSLNLELAGNTTYRMYMGVDSSLLAPFIQGNELGVGWLPLLLNPNGGNVGIGTTSPLSTLDCAGTIRSTATGSVPSSGVGIEVWYDGSNARIVGYNRSTSVYIPAYLDGLPLLLNTQSGGNVGIGTTSPGALLDSVGVIRSTGYVSVPTSGVGVEILYDTTTPKGLIDAYDRGASTYHRLEINGAPLQLNMNGANVGIGTSSPTAVCDSYSPYFNPLANTDSAFKAEGNYSGGLTFVGPGFAAGMWLTSNPTTLHFRADGTDTGGFPNNFGQISLVSNGHVGIGVYNPPYPLSVVYTNGSGAAAETGILVQNLATTNSAQIQLLANRSWSILVYGSVVQDQFAIHDNTAGADRLNIDTAGTVHTSGGIACGGTITNPPGSGVGIGGAGPIANSVNVSGGYYVNGAPISSGGISGISGYWSNGGAATGPYGGTGYSGVQITAGSNMSVACGTISNSVPCINLTVGYISDMRLKDYAEPLQGGIDVVLQIHPIYAQWNGLMGKPKGKAIATVSAQELQVIMPYAVDPVDVQLDPETDVSTEILSYDPVAITLQCVLAIQQLVERIESLESRIKSYIH